MALNYLPITVCHWYANYSWSRLFRCHKLSITSGLKPRDIAKTGKTYIANFHNRTIAVGKFDPATIVDLDRVEKRRHATFVNFLRRNHNSLTQLIQDASFVSSHEHAFSINQERPVTGVANTAIVWTSRYEHPHSTDR